MGPSVPVSLEIDALENQHTWTLVPLPHDKKPIGCKRVYKIKRKVEGGLDQYKVRFVAKGFTQQEGVDSLKPFPRSQRRLHLRSY